MVKAIEKIAKVKAKEALLKHVKDLIQLLEEYDFKDYEISSWEVKVKFIAIGKRFNEVDELLQKILEHPYVLDVDYVYANKKMSQVTLNDLYEIAKQLERGQEEQ